MKGNLNKTICSIDILTPICRINYMNRTDFNKRNYSPAICICKYILTRPSL